MEVGGAQRQVVNLMRSLDSARFEQCLICLERKGALGEELERNGFPVLALGKQGRVHPAMLWALVRELRRWKPEVVHTSVFTANLWGRLCAMAAGVPVRIAHEQSTVSLEKWYRRVLDWMLSWGTYRILAVSDDLRTHILAEERLSASRVEVLYNAVDCEALRSGSRETGKESAPLPGQPGWRIGLVGRLEYRKDHVTLVRAAARVVEQMPQATFLLVGEGPDRGKIEEAIRTLGMERNVFLLGERQDVAWILGQLDVYVLCSITEGLSLSILEAMAVGAPVLATRVGGNAELLDEGRAGLLTPAGEVEALAEAILCLLKDPERRRELARRAGERVTERFDVHAVARRLEAIYESGVRQAGRLG
jgi:glycosyltransferase involved in cell wall biosynthesis